MMRQGGEEMNERIAEIRKAAGMTQEEFAAKIGLSRNFIWMIEKGDRTPSDRTIADICREFGISEHWLRTGEGEMQIQMSEDDELTQIFTEIGASDDELAKAAIRMYWHLSEKEKAVIHKMADNLVAELMKKKSPGE